MPSTPDFPDSEVPEPEISPEAIVQWSQKIREGHARNRLQALPPPGRAPYGYKRGKDRYAIDRATAPVVKDFFEQFLLYGSLRGAVRYLAKRYGKKISTSTAQRWLTHPVYRGDLCYKANEVVRDTHTPLISREEAAQIDRLLRRNRCLAPRTASADRSLAGLVRCAMCGSRTTVTRVTIRGKTQSYLYLRPTDCTQKGEETALETKDKMANTIGSETLPKRCKSIPYDRLLAQVIDEICNTLPPAVNQLQSPELGGLKQQLERSLMEKQEILEQLPDLQAQGILDEPSTQLRTRTLRQEMATLRSQLDQLPPVNLKELVQAVAIPQFWQDLSETERRFFFREFIRHIEFNPCNDRISLTFVFDPPELSGRT